jgi:hypothetical protein
MQNDEKNLNEQIDQLLKQSAAEIIVPSDFHREVWRRLEQESSDHHAFFDQMAWWLLRPLRELILIALVALLAFIWGLTHPPTPDYSDHDAYLLSISPFDPHHYEALSP